MIFFFFFFFNDTATTEIYTLSLHDALPIYRRVGGIHVAKNLRRGCVPQPFVTRDVLDRKSTRLNSSYEWISYAVFCLKKKKKNTILHFTLKKITIYTYRITHINTT